MIHTIDLHFLHSADTIAAFLVETSCGPVLIETGPHSTLSALEKGVQQAGYALGDIKHVLLSHIHLDHAGAAWVLAQMGATIHVHPAGEKHLRQPEKLMQSARMIYQEQMDMLWGEMHPIPAEQLKPMEHGETLTLGDTAFTAWHTPGHAVHHLAWQYRDQLFTGDVAGVKINDGIVVPPCPPPDIHIEDWQASLALIRDLQPKTLWLTHYGPVHEVEAHLQELEARLLDWAAWMKPYAEANDTLAHITPLFSRYVQQQLLEKAMRAEEIAAYDKANPAWMSVSGLLRYWKKKTDA
jgi:glyoxylase-like metal-dependent hydrolase (beta-lactamase superfamily II)